MWDCVSIVVLYSIDDRLLQQLCEKMDQYFRGNTVDFTGPNGIDYANILDNHRIDLKFWYECRGNWQNTGLKGQRRMRAFNRIREVAKELGITYTPLAQNFNVLKPPTFDFGK
eukprot:NODE_1_length_95616_cov_0.657642.p77 type:complete len:113 gc:universal NODE_1_length_95616_cov_0.657642:32433-32771(+)